MLKEKDSVCEICKKEIREGHETFVINNNESIVHLDCYNQSLSLLASFFDLKK